MKVLGHAGTCAACNIGQGRPFVLESLGVKVWACSQSCGRAIVNDALALAI